MNYIGKKIYYDKNTGNIIRIVGERMGTLVRATTIDEDFANYETLQGRTKQSIGCKQLKYGQYKNEFNTCTGYRINLKTEEIEFDFTPIETNPTMQDINRQVIKKNKN